MDSSIGNRLMRLQQVMQVTGLARSTIYKLIARGEFPSSVKLTARAVGWRSYDVDRWISSRLQSGALGSELQRSSVKLENSGTGELPQFTPLVS